MSNPSTQSHRKFTSHGPAFELECDERKRLIVSLGRNTPESVIDEVEEAVGLARSYKRLNLDCLRATTKAGRKELQNLESLSRKLADGFREASPEIQHFLDFTVPNDSPERSALLASQVARAQEIHEGEFNRSALIGVPGNVVARGLALELARVWEAWSGRGWSHRGAWGGFVKMGLDMAGVEAAAVNLAQWAAREHKNRAAPSSVPRRVER